MLSYVYELPFGPGKALLRSGRPALGKIFGGWQINGNTTFQSGFPAADKRRQRKRHFCRYAAAQLERKNATLSGPVIRTPSVAIFRHSAFSFNAPFTFGNAPRMMPILRCPGVNNFDISAFQEYANRLKRFACNSAPRPSTLSIACSSAFPTRHQFDRIRCGQQPTELAQEPAVGTQAPVLILAVLALTSTAVQIETSVVQNKLHERLLVKHEARWVEIASSNGLTQGPL